MLHTGAADGVGKVRLFMETREFVLPETMTARRPAAGARRPLPDDAGVH